MSENVLREVQEIKLKHSYEKIRGIKKVNEKDIDWLIDTVENQCELIISQQRSLFESDEKIEKLHREITELKNCD